jgi:DNA-binding SARP family transcriptional activator
MDEGPFYLKILGSFEITDGDGARIELPRGNARWILASLVLEFGPGISEQRLIEQVWGPRGTSIVALRSAVSRLRGWIAAAEFGELLRIEYTGTGYQLRARRFVTDAGEFKEQFEAAAKLEGEERFAALLRAASLWRESALADAPPGLRHHPVTADLDHRRSQAAVQLVHAARHVGRTAEVLEILRRTAHDLPYDEPLQAAFLTAANEAGLRTEAVRHFGVLSNRLAVELGVSPSPDLLRAAREGGHVAAATADPPRAAAAAAMARPGPAAEPARPELEHGLPRPVVDFVGRAAELAAIWSALTDERGARPVYVMGPPGIGKTELCLNAAQHLRAEAGLRVLYAPLAGSTDLPAAPHDVMRRFVQAMEPAADASEPDPERLSARYQSLLARRPTLIVLDEVAGAAQVRPLLPTSDSCRVLINGRIRSPALAGVTILELCRLTIDEGVRLLSSYLGARRAAESELLLPRIVDYVDGHPLALRTAGLRLASHPHWTVAWMTEILRDPRTRLTGLSHDGLSVRQLISDAFGSLPAQSAAMLLQLHRSGVHNPCDGRMVIEIGTPAQAAAVDELVARWIVQPWQARPGSANRDAKAVRISKLLDAYLTELEGAATPERARG